MSAAVPAWTIVVTKPMQEDIAERSLRQAGYRVYLPRYRKLLLPHGRERKPTTAMRPLFSGLLFAQDWRGWPTTPVQGTIGLMQAYPGTAKLSDIDVRIIMDRERSCEFDEVSRPNGGGPVIRDDIEIGAEVEIEAFGSRILGVLDDLSDNGKAVVSAMVFGRSVRMTVDASALMEAVQK